MIESTLDRALDKIKKECQLVTYDEGKVFWDDRFGLPLVVYKLFGADVECEGIQLDVRLCQAKRSLRSYNRARKAMEILYPKCVVYANPAVYTGKKILWLMEEETARLKWLAEKELNAGLKPDSAKTT